MKTPQQSLNWDAHLDAKESPVTHCCWATGIMELWPVAHLAMDITPIMMASEPQTTKCVIKLLGQGLLEPKGSVDYDGTCQRMIPDATPAEDPCTRSTWFIRSSGRPIYQLYDVRPPPRTERACRGKGASSWNV